MNQDYDDLQLSNPWFDESYRIAQSKLFIAALRVRKQFLYENRKNIRAAFIIWNQPEKYLDQKPGLGGGAEVIIVPEHTLDIVRIVEKLQASKARGKLSGIVVLAEGAGHADEVAAKIKEISPLSVRSTVLGHLQRGGSPSMKDRFLGTSWGVHAVKLLEKGIGNRICGIRDNKIYDMDIVEGCAMKKQFNLELYQMASIVAR